VPHLRSTSQLVGEVADVVGRHSAVLRLSRRPMGSWSMCEYQRSPLWRVHHTFLGDAISQTESIVFGRAARKGGFPETCIDLQLAQRCTWPFLGNFLLTVPGRGSRNVDWLVHRTSQSVLLSRSIDLFGMSRQVGRLLAKTKRSGRHVQRPIGHPTRQHRQ
jgi:hypothetical protein